MIIQERIETDQDYNNELSRLFDLFFDEDEVYESVEFQELYERYFKKHSPKKGTMEYYQLFHRCQWVAPFVAELIYQSLGIKTEVIATDSHSASYNVLIKGFQRVSGQNNIKKPSLPTKGRKGRLGGLGSNL
ncbi:MULTISPECIES: hypothetical protein [Brevibacillus]|uniref:hypothetical protein n=1 Tax=Brevibacillus TaxID=55080 RepID=UPI0036265EBE